MKYNQQPTLVLLCALPGAGKTTLAKKLAEEMPAVRFCPDDWMQDLGISLWNTDVRDALEKKCFWSMTQELLKLGQSVVLEYGFWARSERDHMLLGAKLLGARVELHYLDVPTKVLKQRLAQRGMEGDTELIDRIEEYAAKIEAPGASELKLYDNHKT